MPAEPALVGKVAVTGTTHHDETRRQWFRQVSNAFIRMVNFGDNNELACYNLTEDGSSERPMILGELCRAGAE